MQSGTVIKGNPKLRNTTTLMLYLALEKLIIAPRALRVSVHMREQKLGKRYYP